MVRRVTAFLLAVVAAVGGPPPAQADTPALKREDILITAFGGNLQR
ncbi:MAG TPA: hypothetical protein VIU11_22930 [Nakamurella sp.]